MFLKRSKVIFFNTFLNFVNSFANSPGTPSSSYNNDYNYHDKSKNNVNEKLKNQIPIQTPNQIVIQGNRRLENELILRSSGIDKFGTDDKSLSLAIKNLYKTGYFEDVKIFKDKIIIFINVKENPIIDLISIEGNKEITDDIILEELITKSEMFFQPIRIKLDSEKILTLYKRQGFFFDFR